MWSRVFGKGVCLLVPLLFNIFFTAVLRVAEKRFTADAVVMDSMVQLLSMEKRGKKEGRARAGRPDGQKEEAAQTLWGILYADDAGIISRSPEELEKMMTVIVTACTAFGLTMSEAKTEIMCLQTKGGGHVPFTVIAAGHVYKETVEFVRLGLGYQRRLGPQKCRGHPSNLEGMGVLRTV